MAGRGDPTAPTQQAEPIVQPRGDLLDRQGAHARRGQLDRQRDPLQAAADLGHRGRIRLAHAEADPGRPGAVQEQPTRSIALQVSDCPYRAGDGERCDHPDRLAVDVKRLAAGHEGAHARAGGEQRADQRGARGHQVLAVVQDEERLARTHVIRQDGGRLPPGRLAHSERRRHHRRNEPRIGDAGQLDQPDAVGELSDQLVGHRKRQAGLPDPADAGQRDQPPLGQQAPYLGDVPLPADEAGESGGQVVRRADQRERARPFGGPPRPQRRDGPGGPRAIGRPRASPPASGGPIRHRVISSRCGSRPDACPPSAARARMTSVSHTPRSGRRSLQSAATRVGSCEHTEARVVEPVVRSATDVGYVVTLPRGSRLGEPDGEVLSSEMRIAGSGVAGGRGRSGPARR